MITSPEQLIDWLHKLPKMIRDAEKEMIEKETELERAKLELQVAKSEAVLNSERPNATEKTAFGLSVTKEQQLKVIEAQRGVDLKESEVKYLNNRFISLRKITSIEETLIKSQLGGT